MWTEETYRGQQVASTQVQKLDPELSREIWRHVAQLFSEQRKDWDYVRAEYWGEGRWVIYPAHSANTDRIDNVGCDVYVTDLRDEEARLVDELLGEDDDLDPDGKFDQAVEALELRFAQQLLAGAAAALQVPVRAYSYEDRQAMAEAKPGF